MDSREDAKSHRLTRLFEHSAREFGIGPSPTAFEEHGRLRVLSQPLFQLVLYFGEVSADHRVGVWLRQQLREVAA